MLRKALWSAFRWSRGLGPHLAELDRFAALRPDQARRELACRLLCLVQYFGNREDSLPEWREAARIRDPEELWRIWPSLPCVTKHDLQTRFEPQTMQRRFGLRGIISSTGGSTGEPTPYLHDRGMLQAMAATRLYTRLKFGWRPGMATIGVWGSERDIEKQTSFASRLSAYLRNEWLVAGYRLDSRTVDEVLSLLYRHRRVAMFGFSSMLQFVAGEVLARGIRLPHGCVQAAWNGGEMLFDSQVELFQRAFGAPLRNLYGGRELSAMAYQDGDAKPLRVLRPLLMVEIVDEHNRPVPPGQSGRLLWTSTCCRGTPFVRYDIGDIGCASPQDQDESGIRALTELQGRSAGLLRLPSGHTINCLFWNHLFKEFREIQQFQVVILNDRELLLNLKGTPWGAERESHVRRILQRLLGDLPVSVRWVDRIPLTSQGKLVQVVRQL